MSLGESKGGLPPDSVVEEEDTILEDTERVITSFHDPAPGAMVRVVVAPCSPFSVSADLMKESAAQARRHGVHMHTHVAETLDEEQFCLDTFGRRPVELMEDLDWAGDDVWFAHGIYINDAEILRMASSGTGVAHCPSSNMRLASGIAPVRKYLAADVRLGIGVDGSASNDGSHLIAEARQAMLLARLAAAPSLEGGELLTARQALRVATRGSARVLGRDDVGSLEVGKCADFVGIDLNRLEYAGAWHDPVAGLLFASPTRVDVNYVHGRPVVKDGELVGADTADIIERHNAAAARLLG
jgi:cytosine/adenosine deaminase-related metal-dependent hydrolase